MITKKSLFRFFLLFFSLNFLTPIKAEPPTIHVRLLGIVGAVGGFAVGASCCRNPEAYIDLIPIATAPICSVLGGVLVPFLYSGIYSLCTEEKQ